MCGYRTYTITLKDDGIIPRIPPCTSRDGGNSSGRCVFIVVIIVVVIEERCVGLDVGFMLFETFGDFLATLNKEFRKFPTKVRIG